jgi:hypothetical protein
MVEALSEEAALLWQTLQMCGSASFLPAAPGNTSASSKASQLRVKCSRVLYELATLVVKDSRTAKKAATVCSPESALWLLRPHPCDMPFLSSLLGQQPVSAVPPLTLPLTKEVRDCCRHLITATRVLDAGWLLISDLALEEACGVKRHITDLLEEVDILLKSMRRSPVPSPTAATKKRKRQCSRGVTCPPTPLPRTYRNFPPLLLPNASYFSSHSLPFHPPWYARVYYIYIYIYTFIHTHMPTQSKLKNLHWNQPCHIWNNVRVGGGRPHLLQHYCRDTRKSTLTMDLPGLGRSRRIYVRFCLIGKPISL